MSERVRAERGEVEAGLWGPDRFGVILSSEDGYVDAFVGFPSAARADAFIDQVNTEPLPPYVYRDISGFTYVNGASNTPPGWRVVGIEGTEHTRVEPVPPAPATERVPWQQSIGRKLPNGKPIIGADETPIQPRVKVGPVSRASCRFVDADGTVEVLSLPEGEQQ